MTALVHFHKQDHGQTANVYRLIGRNEDALTYGLGHLMAIDDEFMLEVLKELAVIPRIRGRRYQGYRASYEVYLQEQRNVGGAGRRDIVLEAGGEDGLRVVMEAKIGRGQPTACQLLRYSVGCACKNHRTETAPDWGSRSAKYLVALTRSPLDSGVRTQMVERLKGSGITIASIQWHRIVKLALDRLNRLEGRSLRSLFFSEFVSFFRGFYEMDLYDAEVMVQDEDPRNAPIYFDGYMYVGGRRWPKMPLYFAPYFTKACAWDATLPQVTTAGISWISKVTRVQQVTVTHLVRDAKGVADRDLRRYANWTHWRRGLEGIRELAKRDAWTGDVWLYFLSEPVSLGRTIKKTKRLTRLVPGFKTTLFDLLKSDTLGASA
jgi:hypothetical protein